MMKQPFLPRSCHATLAIAFIFIPFSAALGAKAAHAAPATRTVITETTMQSKKDEYHKKVWAKLMAAVKAEKMTMAEAKAKMEAIKKGKGQGKRRPLTKKDLAAIAKKLKAAVAANKLTEAEAKAKWEKILKKWKASQKGKDSGKKLCTKEYLAAVKKKLAAAVKANKLTEAEAKAKWAAIIARQKSKKSPSK